MKKCLAWILTCALCLSLIPTAVAAPADPALNRGELAQLLVQVCGLEDRLADYTGKPSPFSDVDAASEYAPAVTLAADQGLLQGNGDGTFAPQAEATPAAAATALLRWAGLTDAQLGPWPRGHAQMAEALGLTPGQIATRQKVTQLAAQAAALRTALTAQTPAPYFVDGQAQPIFPYETVVREVVYVETDGDTDGDGKADLVKVLVQRPAATDAGMKAAAIFEARPYSAGTTDAYGEDSWNAHVVDAALTEAKTSTTTTRESWKPTQEPQPAALTRRTPTATGKASDGGAVWNMTENVDAYDYWLVRGYANVSSAGLGTLDSEGFETCGSYEETAAFAQVVRWLSGEKGVRAFADKEGKTEVKADWCNGSVAMSGQSYAGTTAFAVAATGVAGLKTIVPRAGIASWYDYYRSQGTAAGGLFYPGDDCDILADYCMSRQLDEADYAKVKTGYEAYLAQMIKDQDRLGGDYNTYWYERDYTNGAKSLNCSALILHGLNDFNVKPKQFDLMYKAFAENDQTAKLILHQGAHYTPEQIDGLDLNGILGRWYAHYLYGVENGAEKDPAVRVQSNVDLSWNTYDGWDTAAKTLTLAAGSGESKFSSDLSLTSFDTTKADVDEGWIEYCTDMAYAWEADMLRGDTGASAVYRLDVKEDTHISGTVRVAVTAAADRPTGILSAMLVDIAPQGGMEAVVLESYGESVPTKTLAEEGIWYGGGLAEKELLQFATTHVDNKVITRGWMDIQNRTSIYNVDTVKPGEYYTFTLELQPMDYVVKAGHQLGLVLYSADPLVTYWPKDVTTFTVDNAATVVTIPVQ